MAKSTAALTKLLAGLDDPDSQDPEGFGREDVDSISCRGLPEAQGILYALHHYLHSPDYSRAGLAKRLRALKGLA